VPHEEGLDRNGLAKKVRMPALWKVHHSHSSVSCQGREVWSAAALTRKTNGSTQVSPIAWLRERQKRANWSGFTRMGMVENPRIRGYAGQSAVHPAHEG
jgi:hypothetical protein